MLKVIGSKDNETSNTGSSIKYIFDFINEIEKISGLEINLKNKVKIKRAYLMAKYAFGDQIRDDNSKAFLHTKRVCLILANFDKLTVDKIIIAILHDVIEDTSKSYEDILEVFGDKIADKVKSLSKKEWSDYMYKIPKKLLGSNEIKYLETRKKIEQTRNLRHIKDYEKIEELIYAETKSHKIKITKNIKIRSKQLRNEEYFGKMKNLPDGDLIIKLADRIDGLYTMQEIKYSKVKRKIEETIKYFLPLAKERFPMIYKIMFEQIDKIIREKKLKIMMISSILNLKNKKETEKIIEIKRGIEIIQKSYSGKIIE